MKNIILILSAIFLFSCSSQKKVTSSTSQQAKEKKEGRKIYGTVSETYLREHTTLAQEKAAKKAPLSLKVDNEFYLVKISNPNISVGQLEKLIGKKIEVQGKLIGEGYGGETSTTMPPVNKKVVEEDGGKKIGHIVIYEILEVEK